MSNSKYDEPRYVNGKRTAAGEAFENARKKALRPAQPPQPPKRPRAGTPVPLGEFVKRVPIINPYWTEADAEAWIAYYFKQCGMGPTFNLGNLRDIEAFNVVPTERLREAYLLRADDTELTKLFVDELHEARKIHGPLGTEHKNHEDVSKYLKKLLGVYCFKEQGLTKVNLLVSYHLAAVICKSLGLRPYDVGV